MGFVEIINKQWSKEKKILQLVIAVLTYIIFFKAKHMRGKPNCIVACHAFNFMK